MMIYDRVKNGGSFGRITVKTFRAACVIYTAVYLCEFVCNYATSVQRWPERGERVCDDFRANISSCLCVSVSACLCERSRARSVCLCVCVCDF